MKNNPDKKLFSTHPEANFLQSEIWAKVNSSLGHKVILEDIAPDTPCLMIVKNARRGRYLEIPGGPLLDWKNTSEVEKSLVRIQEIARKNKCVFVRFRPQLEDNPENREIFQKLTKSPQFSLRLAPFHLHAQNTVIIDLSKPEDELLSAMRRQTRYEVRRSAKLALEVKKGHSEALFEEFHACQLETAQRQGFIPPSSEDLFAYRDAFGENATIYKVSTTQPITPDGKKLADNATENPIPADSIIAYGLILKAGSEAEYFEAASTELGHKLPGAYALLWQAMQDLKSEGIERFNLWGIAPPDPENPETHLKNHRYSGVTTFKTGFGGREVNFIPAHDLIISPARYSLTYAIETIRKKRRNL